MQSNLFVSALLTVATVATSASAANEAWETAKRSAITDAQVTLGVNLPTLQNAGADYAKRAYAYALASAPRLQVLDNAFRNCGTELRVSVQNIVVVSDKPSLEGDTVVYVATQNLPVDAIRKCLASATNKVKWSEADKDGIMGVKESGLFEKTNYFAYTPKGVLVVASDPTDLKLLQSGLRTSFKMPRALVLNPDTNATLWGAFERPSARGKDGRVSIDCQRTGCRAKVTINYPDEKLAEEAVGRFANKVTFATEVASRFVRITPAQNELLTRIKTTPVRVGTALVVDVDFKADELKLVLDAFGVKGAR